MQKYQIILSIRHLKKYIESLISNEEYISEDYSYKSEGFSKIDIFAFIEDKNIGDPVIGETAKFLVEDICEKNDLKAIINLHRLFPSANYRKYWITRRLRWLCAKNTTNLQRFIMYLMLRGYLLINPRYRNYYTKTLKHSDLTIFGGGGMLKYFSQEFWASDYCIIDYCDRHKIPVYFNAIGIEGYDDKNFTSRLIKKLLNKKCISKVTTRDDIDALNKFLPQNNNLVVGDSALYSKELYGSEEKTDIIGINTIRSGIFNTNGFRTTEEDLITFYCEMITRLNADGLKWQIFTNGLKSDYNLGVKILSKLNIKPTQEVLAPLPTTGLELARNISRYRGVIAGRMHAHIIATSYDIPTVGQIWNEKIKWFSKHLGAEDRFFYPDEISNYDLVYNKFKQALEEGNSNLNTNKLKEATYKELELEIKNTLKNYPKINPKKVINNLKDNWKIYKKIEKEIKNVQVNLEIGTTNPYPQKIWTMWLQGMEEAPPIVKACVDSLKKYSSREVILLTKKNLAQYVKLPDFIEDKYKKGLIGHAHYSDIVRLYLLEKYGGTWIDATVYCVRPFDELINYELMITQSYSKKNPKIMTNYFLHSENPHNYLIQSMLCALYEYWEKNNSAIDYAIFHYIHRVLIENNKACKAIWDKMPKILNTNFKLLRVESYKEYNENYINYLINFSPLHKFSYKKEFIAKNIAKNSLYNKIIEPYL